MMDINFAFVHSDAFGGNRVVSFNDSMRIRIRLILMSKMKGSINYGVVYYIAVGRAIASAKPVGILGLMLEMWYLAIVLPQLKV